MKNFGNILLVCFFIITAKGQDYKFGKISKEELEETKYNQFPEAHAAVLYEHRESYILNSYSSISLITEMYKKIKIYDQDAVDVATQEILLFKTRHESESVKKIKAVTYNLENGKIVEYKLDKDQIFETNLSYSYDQVKFTMPNVKEGSVIEIYYEVSSPYYRSFDDVIFQRDYPIKKYYAEIRTPEIYSYKKTMKGFIDISLSKDIKLDHRLGLNVNVDIYQKQHIPALKEEPFIDNINNYRGAVIYELQGIDHSTYFESFSQTWSDVAKEIGNEKDYKTDLDKNNVVDDIVDPLIKGVTDPKVKMQKLFNYVRNNYKWNEYEGKYFFNGLKKTIKEKTGNAADINLLLVAMLRYAGIDANPIVISTKDNTIPLFPTLNRLNYVIAHAQIEDQEFLMDATHEFSDVNVLPINDYNWEGIYINNNSMKWKKISLLQPEPSLEKTNILCSIAEDGSANSKLRTILDKHDAMNFRIQYKKSKGDEFLNQLENKYDGIEVSDFSVVNEKTTDKNIIQNFSFYYDNAAEKIGDKLLLSPMLFLTIKENPFVIKERKFPIDFNYPYEAKKAIIINIPEGYKVEYIPESKIMQLPQGIGEVKYLLSETQKGIQITYQITMNSSMISPLYYQDIKDFFGKMVEIESEKVILSKA